MAAYTPDGNCEDSPVTRIAFICRIVIHLIILGMSLATVVLVTLSLNDSVAASISRLFGYQYLTTFIVLLVGSILTIPVYCMVLFNDYRTSDRETNPGAMRLTCRTKSGSLQKNKNTFRICIILSILAFAVVLTGGILSFAVLGRAKLTESEMLDSLKRYNEPSIKETWDITQRELHCCGATNWYDWEQEGFGSVPASCCKELPNGQRADCNSGPYRVNPSTTYVVKCSGVNEKYVQKQGTIPGNAGIILASCILLDIILQLLRWRSMAGKLPQANPS